MYEYDKQFYHYINQGARDSASQLLPVLQALLPAPVTSVLDVACGAGAWLSVWKSLGAQVSGLDGDYVQPEQLLIESGEFEAADLRARFDLGRSFDLVQSLEVAEHLPASSAAGFVASLCRHAPLVLFSAAPPGQGGENHVNEQPYDYWRALFREQGFVLCDPIRPALLHNTRVKPWYRYNTFVYVGESASPALKSALAAYQLPEGQPVADLSPTLYQWRKRAISHLPRSASTALAIIKKSLLGVSFKGRRGAG